MKWQSETRDAQEHEGAIRQARPTSITAHFRTPGTAVQRSHKLRDNRDTKITMDRNRNRKRKANDAASPKAEGSASKRQKTRLVSAHRLV